MPKVKWKPSQYLSIPVTAALMGLHPLTIYRKIYSGSGLSMCALLVDDKLRVDSELFECWRGKPLTPIELGSAEAVAERKASRAAAKVRERDAKRRAQTLSALPRVSTREVA